VPQCPAVPGPISTLRHQDKIISFAEFSNANPLYFEEKPQEGPRSTKKYCIFLGFPVEIIRFHEYIFPMQFQFDQGVLSC